MTDYQLQHHMQRVIDYITFNIDLSCNIVENTIDLLKSYPIEWRKEIYSSLVCTLSEEQWHDIIVEIFTNTKLEKILFTE